MINKLFVLCLLSISSVLTLAEASESETLQHSPTETRISARKCNEYKEFVYDITYGTYGLDGILEIKTPRCTAEASPLVYNGVEVIINELPHMASVGIKMNENFTDWVCGGTLISEEFVLSAAHCTDHFEQRWNCSGHIFLLGTFDGTKKHSCTLVNVPYPPTHVRLGEHDLTVQNESSVATFEIVEIIKHPSYVALNNRTDINDIALLKINKVKFTPAIRPACLHDTATVPDIATAAGWGEVQFNNSRKSDVLQKVKLDVFTRDECNNTTLGNSINGLTDDKILCAGSRSDSRDTCQGDSGGPIHMRHKSYYCTYTVIGITSSGIGCGTKGLPAAYTRVYGFLDWIESIVWPEE